MLALAYLCSRYKCLLLTGKVVLRHGVQAHWTACVENVTWALDALLYTFQVPLH